jgi:hypothetical protein
MTEGTPRRHTLTDAYNDLKAVVEQLTTRTSEPYVSVEFTRNAKGETQISTKVSAPSDVSEVVLAELGNRVYLQAVAIYDTATANYPSTAA